jgi:hypothetical protein
MSSTFCIMHIATKAYVSHTCHRHLARNLHHYVGCVVPVARNHLKLFWDSYGSRSRCCVKFWNFPTKFAYYSHYLLI